MLTNFKFQCCLYNHEWTQLCTVWGFWSTLVYWSTYTHTNTDTHTHFFMPCKHLSLGLLQSERIESRAVMAAGPTGHPTTFTATGPHTLLVIHKEEPDKKWRCAAFFCVYTHTHTHTHLNPSHFWGIYIDWHSSPGDFTLTITTDPKISILINLGLSFCPRLHKLSPINWS